MPLLNYTTEIHVSKTISEIEHALAGAGAEAIMKEYDPASRLPRVISFRMATKHGVIAFKLPARLDAAQRVLDRQVHEGKIPKRFRGNAEQAARVAWRIVREWTLAQLALLELEQADPADLFLAFALGPDGRTVAEKFSDLKANGFLLTE